MAKFSLTRKTPLNGYSKTIGTLELAEVPICLVSVAIPKGKTAALSKAVKQAFGCAMPKPNKTSVSKDNARRLIWMQSDQIFVAFESDNPKAEQVMISELGGAGYVTDQTHGWTAVSLTGADVVAALERTCPIDLSNEAFPVGASTRTGMEHMHVVLVRTSKESYLMLSASSSAQSFLHMIETSAKYVS